MTWQIYKVAVFWKTWPRSKGATRAVGLKNSATAKGRSRGDWLLSRYMEIMFFFVFFVVFFFKGKWLVIEILKCVMDFCSERKVFLGGLLRYSS